MNDRIRLAEAMGYKIERKPPYSARCSDGLEATHRLISPEGYGQVCHSGNLSKYLPDPFTDANDDYAVLEWMRSDINRWTYQFKPELISFSLELYEPGDYARAALKVLDTAYCEATKQKEDYGI